MNKQGAYKLLYTWPVIILILILFWPVGLYLLMKKLDKDNKSNSKSIWYKIGIAFFALYCVAGFFQFLETGFVFEDFFFFVISLLILVFLYKKYKQKATNELVYNDYLNIILNDNVYDFTTLMNVMDKSYEQVKKDIETLIKDRRLENAYIDEYRNMVIIKGRNEEEKIVSIKKEKVVEKMVICKCCGASNVLHNGKGECEYCGSPLE